MKETLSKKVSYFNCLNSSKLIKDKMKFCPKNLRPWMIRLCSDTFHKSNCLVAVINIGGQRRGGTQLYSVLTYFAGWTQSLQPICANKSLNSKDWGSNRSKSRSVKPENSFRPPTSNRLRVWNEVRGRYQDDENCMDMRARCSSYKAIIQMKWQQSR